MIHRLLDDGKNMDEATIETLEWVVDAYPEEYLLMLRGIGISPMDTHFQAVCVITAMCLRSERDEREIQKIRILELETEVATLRRDSTGNAAFAAFSGDGHKLNEEERNATETMQVRQARLTSHPWKKKGF
jgi:hypothetical protein